MRSLPWSMAVLALGAPAAWCSFQVPSQFAQDVLPADATPTTPVTLDDSVPLPVPARYASGADGDVLLEPASGDPFFLGFAAGAYAPPAGERIDPALLASLQSHYADGRPASETYAFVMFERRITPARLDALRSLGARVLGFHPHYCMKVALPASSVDLVAELDFVRWIGVAKSWQKVHPDLVARASALPAGRAIDVIVDVFDSDLNSDSVARPLGTSSSAEPGGAEIPLEAPAGYAWQSNGWQQRALEAAGLEVSEYLDRTRAFRARMLPAALEGLTALDFVQFVEADVAPQPFHDESMPATLMDYSRGFFDGGVNQVAVVGEIDSGFDAQHVALNHVSALGNDFTSEGSTFLDNCGHGSHVAGTIFGLPPGADVELTGGAPGLGSTSTLRVRAVKMFDENCDNAGASIQSLFDALEGDGTDSSGNVTARPHAINNSWGAGPGSSAWIGSENNARTLDAQVWDHQQLYVFAAGNDGPGAGTIGLPGVAKNALTVASYVDFEDPASGDASSLANTSSRGPAGDGRWKPNVAAPGRWIESVEGESGNQYVEKSGTSMAAPHVTALACQLVDRSTFFHYAPQRIASLLMATAFTDNDQTLSGPSGASLTHFNGFGAGRINASKAVVNGTGAGNWINWGGTLNSSSSTHQDFTISANATRLVVVFTYYEDQSSAGASQALVSDFDLFLDSPTNGIDPADDTGEFTAQQSSLDNTEIRILNNPLEGTWRWKVFPTNATGSIRYSVTQYETYDDTTPDGTLTLSTPDTTVKPNQDVPITAVVFNPSYYADNVFLDQTSTGDTLQSTTTTLFDGTPVDLANTIGTSNNLNIGRDVMVGSIFEAQDRQLEWVTRWATEGVKTWQVEARSDNWVDETQSLQITVDGTFPNVPPNLHSTSHTPGVWSPNPQVAVDWDPATDNLSGIDGYSGLFTQTGGLPDTIKDFEENQTATTSTPLPSGVWSFRVRALDNSGNWGTFSTVSDLRVDTVAPTAATNVHSVSHIIGVLSCNTSLAMQWNSASDAHSGLAGYIGVFNTSASFDPTGAHNLSVGTTSMGFVAPSPGAYYFHLRSKDIAGNLGTTVHVGPFPIDDSPVSIYCTGKTNSLGCVPAIGSVNSPSASGNFTVTCSNVINNKLGHVFWGFNPSSAPFQGGIKCVASPTRRTPVQSSGGSAAGNDCTGAYAFAFDGAFMAANSMGLGDTFYCQWWMRDPASPSTTGLSNALKFTVCQ